MNLILCVSDNWYWLGPLVAVCLALTVIKVIEHVICKIKNRAV